MTTKKYYRENIDKIKKYSHLYYQKYKKLIYAKNKEYMIAYRKRNNAKLIQYAKEYRINNADAIKKKKKIYNIKNKNHINEHKKHIIYNGNRLKLLKKYNYTCQKCNQSFKDSKLDIHHIDRFGSRNPVALQNNNVNNLMLLCEQCHHRLHSTGESNGNAKLTNKKVTEIRKLYNKKISYRIITKQYNISQAVFYKVINHISWKHVI